jgi:uncharacterized membrane protein
MDAVLFIAFSQMIAVENRIGMGWFGDQRYIFFGFFVSTVYLLFHLIEITGLTKLSLYGKLFTVSLFICVTAIGVGNSYLKIRTVSGTNFGISDAGMQSELSGKILSLGQNPYTTNYFQTDLAKIPYSDETGNTINPALYYLAYPPMVPIVGALSYRLIAPRLSWFDIRAVYICFLFLLLGLGYLKWGLRSEYLLFLITVGANPYFLRTILEGANDVMAIFFFIASILLLERKKYWIPAGIIYAMSIGSKQIIWPTVPFVAIALWKIYGLKYLIRFAAVTFVTSLFIFVPFAVNNWKMLYDGLVGYHSGALAHSYPIHNFGFGMMLVQLKLVPNIYAYYNFAVWQAGGLAILGIILYRYLKSVNMFTFILAGWSGAVMILYLFNRAMNYSYLGIMQAAVAIAALWSYKQILPKGKRIIKTK